MVGGVSLCAEAAADAKVLVLEPLSGSAEEVLAHVCKLLGHADVDRGKVDPQTVDGFVDERAQRLDVLCHLDVSRSEEGDDCAERGTKEEEEAAVAHDAALDGQVVQVMLQKRDLGEVELVPGSAWSGDAVAGSSFERRTFALF